MISTHRLTLQGFKVQYDEDTGNIQVIINSERLINELGEIKASDSGCVLALCEKRYRVPSNGKNHTHMAPIVEKRITSSPSELSSPSTTSQTTSQQVDKW